MEWSMNQTRYPPYRKTTAQAGRSTTSASKQQPSIYTADTSGLTAATQPKPPKDADFIRCPLCQKRFSPSEYDQHYRGELAMIQRRKVDKKPLYMTKGRRVVSSSVEELEDGEVSESEGSQITESPTGSLGVRRSNRRRTQRVLVNMAAPESTTPSPRMESRSSSSRSSVSGRRRTSPVEQSEDAVTRKRRITNRIANSSEYSGSSEAHVTPITDDSDQATCFICNKVIEGDVDAINAHVDRCLIGVSNESSPQEDPTSEASSAQDMSSVVEYEWAGETRVRATALFEGGVSGLGDAGVSRSSAQPAAVHDEDVDVDQEDEAVFGESQYTDADLIFAGQQQRPRGPGGRGRREAQETGPIWEEQPLPLDDEHTAAELHRLDAVRGSSAINGGSGGAAQLLIEALKERIRQQERLIEDKQTCLVCKDGYTDPCASVACWHVFCEKCWLHILGTKKLCPKCLRITQPTELRRIYL